MTACLATHPSAITITSPFNTKSVAIARSGRIPASKFLSENWWSPPPAFATNAVGLSFAATIS